MSNFVEYDLNGNLLGPMGPDGLRQSSIAFPDSATAAKYFRKELDSQKKKLDEQKNRGGEFGPRGSVMGWGVGRAMEEFGASPETIKMWIGQKNYTPPPPVDKDLENNVNQLEQNVNNWGRVDYTNPVGKEGRGGDRYIAHVMPGEIMVPPVISPELRARLFEEMSAAGVDPNEHTVGGGMSINPATGLPEFGLGKAFKKAIKSVVSVVNDIPVVGPAILPAVGYAVGGPVGAAVASGAQTKVQGGSWGQAIGAAAGSYIGGQIGGPGSGTVGSSLGEAGFSELASQLPGSIGAATISSITGSLLGSSIGTGIGGMVDKPKMQTWGNEFANMPSYSPPVGQSTGGVAIPGQGADPNVPQGPSAEEQLLAAQRGAGITVGAPQNVNYQSTVIDRETGRPRTINSSFSDNFDRRGSWGSGVSFA